MESKLINIIVEISLNSISGNYRESVFTDIFLFLNKRNFQKNIFDSK